MSYQSNKQSSNYGKSKGPYCFSSAGMGFSGKIMGYDPFSKSGSREYEENPSNKFRMNLYL